MGLRGYHDPGSLNSQLTSCILQGPRSLLSCCHPESLIGQDLDSCQFPDNFTEYLGLSPGLPLSESRWEGRECSREFQRVSVTVDLMDDTSAQIIVKQEISSVDVVPRI